MNLKTSLAHLAHVGRRFTGEPAHTTLSRLRSAAQQDHNAVATAAATALRKTKGIVQSGALDELNLIDLTITSAINRKAALHNSGLLF